MLIGLAGKMESGKSTTALILKEKYGFYKTSFANDLKEMCRSIFKLTEEQTDTTEGKKKLFEEPFPFTTEHAVSILDWVCHEAGWLNCSYEDKVRLFELVKKGKVFTSSRDLLQYIGTEVLRQVFHPDYHVATLFNNLEKQKIFEKYKGVVLDDVRFNNERETIRKNKGFCVFIDPLEPENSIGQSKHLSELDLGDPMEYDYILKNDKTLGLSPLQKNIDEMILSLQIV